MGVFWTFQLLLIVIAGIVTSSLKKNQIAMKIEPVTCILIFVCTMNFELPEIAKN